MKTSITHTSIYSISCWSISFLLNLGGKSLKSIPEPRAVDPTGFSYEGSKPAEDWGAENTILEVADTGVDVGGNPKVTAGNERHIYSKIKIMHS